MVVLTGIRDFFQAPSLTQGIKGKIFTSTVLRSKGGKISESDCSQ